MFIIEPTLIAREFELIRYVKPPRVEDRMDDRMPTYLMIGRQLYLDGVSGNFKEIIYEFT